MFIVGVDGCRGGWLAVAWEPRETEGDGFLDVRIFPDFSELLATYGGASIIAVDMPIGLPERTHPGGRSCDIAARATLGDRQSSLFAVPARAAVYCEDYGDACQTALAHSHPPRKVSRQCFNLFTKIRELDALIAGPQQEQVRECHPEVAFAAMNGWEPLAIAKKVRSRPHPPGLRLRRELLDKAGFPVNRVTAVQFSSAAAGADDLLDACACAVTARRIDGGQARCFPASPDTDSRGLRMEIWG